MNIHQIRTTTDMIRTAADALRYDEDPTRLWTLQDINKGWLQSADERDAMHDLLEAMIEAQERMGEPAPRPTPAPEPERIPTIEEFRATATEMTTTEAAERIGIYADDCWNPTDTVLVYDQNAWLTRRADGSHWTMIENGDWVEPREQLEQRLYDFCFAPMP